MFPPAILPPYRFPSVQSLFFPLWGVPCTFPLTNICPLYVSRVPVRLGFRFRAAVTEILFVPSQERHGDG